MKFTCFDEIFFEGATILSSAFENQFFLNFLNWELINNRIIVRIRIRKFKTNYNIKKIY